VGKSQGDEGERKGGEWGDDHTGKISMGGKKNNLASVRRRGRKKVA